VEVAGRALASAMTTQWGVWALDGHPILAPPALEHDTSSREHTSADFLFSVPPQCGGGVGARRAVTMSVGLWWEAVVGAPRSVVNLPNVVSKPGPQEGHYEFHPRRG